MRITQIYIENFGKHSKIRYTFQQNITQFLEQNGFGKTTFAAFLKAMFYGLPTIRQNTKEFNDRQHYAPFNGGKFGGNITFIHNEQEYTIERFFDQKSETKDSLKVYCNNKEYNGFTEEIGKELFDLDRESFERTTFITADILDSMTTADIQTKLRQFINNTTAECNITTALSQLEKEKKEYKFNKGKGGKIYDLTCRKQACQHMLENLEETANKLEEQYLQYNQLKLELEQMTDNIEVTSKLERYAEYQNKINELHNQLKAMQLEFQNGLPTFEEFETLKVYANKLLQLETMLQQTPFSQAKVDRLQQLQSELNPIPSREKLEEVAQCLQQQTTKQAELQAYRKNTTSKRQLPEEIISTTDNIANHTTNKKKFITILSLIFFIVGIASIATTTFLPKNFGYFTLFPGIILFLSAILLTTFSGKKEKIEDKQQSNVASPLSKSIQAEEQIHETIVLTLEEENNNYTKELQQFFSNFGYTGNHFLQHLTDLRYKIKEYYSLQEEWEDNLKYSEELNRQIIDIKEKIHTQLQPFGIYMQENFLKQFDDLQEKARQFRQLQTQLATEQAEANNYSIKYNLLSFSNQNTAPHANSNTTVLENIEEKRQKYAHIANNIAELEQQLLSRMSYENELESIDNELAICHEQYALLAAAIDYLQQAEENLKNRYIQPLQNKLNAYNIQQTLGIEIKLDSDLNLIFESNGERHSSKHLSTGQRTLSLFVLRLALIDSLFSNEKDKPLLILDDPFVNLDANHMQNCTKILHEIAKSRQIIYFCCHSSRKIV